MSSEHRHESVQFEDLSGRKFSLKMFNYHGDERWSEESHADECGFSGKDFDVPFSTTLRKALEAFPSIAMDADVICGTPRIAGTRIPVYMVLDAVQYYGTTQGALTSYPQLTLEQVKDALSFAGAVLEQPVDHELEALIR